VTTLRPAVLFLVLAICIALSLLPPTSGGYSGYGGYSILVLEVSSVVTQSPIPYVELRYVSFEARAINLYAPFEWLWIGSATPSPTSGRSTNLTVESGNKTEVIGQKAVVPTLEYYAERGAESPRWEIVQRSDFTYTMGFLFATSLNITFQPEIHLTMYNRQLENDWVHDERSERFNNPPSNETLSSWGLSPTIFSNLQRGHDYRAFYIYEITLSKPSAFMERMQWTFEVPSILLLIVLGTSVFCLLFRELRLREALTLYLGSAFFSLPFLLSYIQIGLGSISTAEMFFRLDIYLAMLLALAALALRFFGKKDDENVLDWIRRVLRKLTKQPVLRHIWRDIERSRKA